MHMSESETIRNAKKRLHTMKWNKVITSLIFIILGVVLLIWPNTALDVVCRIVGAGLLVGGVAAVVMFLVSRDRNFVSVAALTAGVIIAVIGLWVFMNPKFLVALVPTIMGIIIIISGVVNLGETITIHREHGDGTLASFILAVLTIALGLLIFFNPFHTAALLVRVLAIVMIFNGISDLWIISRITGTIKDVEQDLKAVDTEGEFVDSGDKAEDEGKRAANAGNGASATSSHGYTTILRHKATKEDKNTAEQETAAEPEEDKPTPQ